METRTYVYKEPYFSIEVKAEGVFSVFILAACLYLFWMNAFNMAGLFIVFGVAAFYHAWNTFIAKVYVHSVTIGKDEISFELFGKIKSYKLRDLKEFRVREYPSSGKIYLRVDDHNAFRGRFWISTKVFENGHELFEKVRDLEYDIHPETLKARARRTNEEYVKRFGYGRHAAKAGNRRRVFSEILAGRGSALVKKNRG